MAVWHPVDWKAKLLIAGIAFAVLVCVALSALVSLTARSG